VAEKKGRSSNLFGPSKGATKSEQIPNSAVSSTLFSVNESLFPTLFVVLWRVWYLFSASI
jgi:hypothetical protein